MDMVSPPALVRVVTFIFSLLFFGYPVGAATELFSGTLKLRYFSSPFSKKFPSWTVPDLSCRYSVVGSGPGPSVHFPHRVPLMELKLEKHVKALCGDDCKVDRCCEILSESGVPCGLRFRSKKSTEMSSVA